MGFRNFDDWEDYGKSKRSPAVLVGVIAVLAALIAVGVMVHRSVVRLKAAVKVAQQEKVERSFLRNTAMHLGELTTQIDQAQKDRTDLLAKETKYRKVAGQRIPQPLSKEAQQRYDGLDGLIEKGTSQYNAVAPEYNHRRAAYTGPWPDGPAPPVMFPSR